VKSLIEGDLSIQDALQRGYGNYSAIARTLKPKVEEELGYKAKLEAIITAVKRTKTKHILQHEDLKKIIAESVINLRTDVAKITVEKTTNTMRVVRETLAGYSEEFFQVLEGTSAITLIFDQKLFTEVQLSLKNARVLDVKKRLAAIVVRSPREIINTPGCAIAFYNPVSMSHINIEETMSCFTDTIMILRMKDVGRAFNVLTDLKSEAGK
jgi:signal transduction histidine kinase